MICLAVDNQCHGCKYFKIEDVVNPTGDHILMCALRQTCWERQRSYLTSCDIHEMDLSGLGDWE